MLCGYLHEVPEVMNQAADLGMRTKQSGYLWLTPDGHPVDADCMPGIFTLVVWGQMACLTFLLPERSSGVGLCLVISGPPTNGNVPSRLPSSVEPPRASHHSRDCV